MVLRMKNFNILGFHWKIRLFDGGIIVWGLPKNGRAWTVCRLKEGGLGKKKGKVFWGGGLTLHAYYEMSNTLFKWFTNNLLKANPHIFLQTLHKKFSVGIHIDDNPIFESHIRFLYKKASRNLDALARIAYSLKFDRRKLLRHAFITSQFS